MVILCASRAAVPDCDSAGAEFVRVGSPYEAAAEILAEPTAAAVIDLRLLGVDHLGLIQIARQMETEVLAVGAVPEGLTSEDLSGVRLVARGDLPATIAALAESQVGHPPAAPETPREPQATQPDEGDLATPAPTPAADPLQAIKGLATAMMMDDVPGGVAEDEAASQPAEQAAKPPEKPPGARPASRHPGLLTPEELAALLEDQQ